MSDGAVLRLLLLGGLLRGLPALIQTQQLVMATVGDEVILNCVLIQPKDVLQVTWQRIFPWGEKNLATCNKYFGQKVNAAFQGKVEVQASGLRNSSIVINSVTEQDDGCYHCLFNAYPEGALTGKTCLQVHEPPPPDPQKIVSVSLKESPTEETDVEFSSDNGGLSITVTSVISVVVSFCFVITIIITIIIIKRPKHQNSQSHRDSEGVTSPEKPLQPIQPNDTPLNQPGSGQVRQRQSTVKREESTRKASSPHTGCKRKLDMTDTK